MRKFILSAAVALSFFGYILYSKHVPAGTVIPPAGLQGISNSALPGDTPTPQATPSVQASAAGSTPPNPTSTPRPTQQAQQGRYKNGNYTGSVADAYYGNVQVEAIIQNGKIADVRFLQYPNDRSTSREINSQAMPYLTEEALQVQSANVDIISGATDTSQAFQQSLSAALSQAS